MKVKKLIKETYNYVKKNPQDILSPKKCFSNLKKLNRRLFSRTKSGKFYDPFDSFEYNEWLKRQKKMDQTISFAYQPLISIIVPVYNVASKYLEICIESVINQTYSNWQLLLIDDASTNEKTKENLKKYENIDCRINVQYRLENGHISVASNDGIKQSKGEFIALLDNDDKLEKNALQEIVTVLNENQDLDFIYTDEDKINESEFRFDPFFKPDWSPDTLLCFNYICHFTVIRKSLIDQVGGFRSIYDGCQDYDLFLRITEITNKIKHISKILYHWRTLPTSTSTGLNKKDYIHERTIHLLEETLQRRNLKAEIEPIDGCNCFNIHYSVENDPLISIIIPIRDQSQVLENCLQSIYEKTIYKNYEIIIVNNNSQEKKTIELLSYFKKKYSNFRVLDLNCQFNYSYLNNEAVKIANGEYIVLLNNDTKIISQNWLTEMVGYASQKQVGIVGVKLLYEDNTIQHGGVIIGLGGVGGHSFINEERTINGPFSFLKINRNCGALTAACIMISKDKYNEVNGLDDNIKVAFNDVDFNLKISEKGYYNIFLGNIELYHLESKSRGLEDTPEKIARFNHEVEYMKNKWGKKLQRDPFYNDNYSYLYNYKLDI